MGYQYRNEVMRIKHLKKMRIIFLKIINAGDFTVH